MKEEEEFETVELKKTMRERGAVLRHRTRGFYSLTCHFVSVTFKFQSNIVLL